MRFNSFLLVLFVIIVLFIACGSDNSDSSDILKPVEFNLTANDQMQYNLKNIVVKEGQKVKINLKNIGAMPLDKMGHNIVILKPNIDIAEFAAKAVQARENDYIPEDETESIIVHSKLLGPGEETSIEFVAPSQGSYKFLC